MLQGRQRDHLRIEVKRLENLLRFPAHSIHGGNGRCQCLRLVIEILENVSHSLHAFLLTAQPSERVQAPTTDLFVITLRVNQTYDRLLYPGQLIGPDAEVTSVKFTDLLERFFGAAGMTRLNLRFEVINVQLIQELRMGRTRHWIPRSVCSEPAAPSSTKGRNHLHHSLASCNLTMLGH